MSYKVLFNIFYFILTGMYMVDFGSKKYFWCYLI